MAARVRRAAWRAAFTFSLVRDPWARLALAFHLTSKNPLDGGFLNRDERAAARANETRSIELFRSWVRHAGRTFPPGAADAWRFTTSDAHGNERAPTFNASQLSWLVDEKGRLIVDEIIRLEDLERRWPQLQERVAGCAARRTAPRATTRPFARWTTRRITRPTRRTTTPTRAPPSAHTWRPTLRASATGRRA